MDIQSCKFKDNNINGISIYQELDTEEELKAHFENQSFLASNLNSPTKNRKNSFFFNYNNNTNLSNNPKFLIIRRDIISHAKINIVNCEVLFNK